MSKLTSAEKALSLQADFEAAGHAWAASEGRFKAVSDTVDAFRNCDYVKQAKYTRLRLEEARALRALTTSAKKLARYQLTLTELGETNE